MTPILCVVPFRNRPDLLDRCLHSLAGQHTPADHVVVVNDASTDLGCWAVAHDWTDDRPGWTLIHHEEHQGTLYGQVEAIRSVEADPEMVVVFVDGDDRLAGPGVLTRLREVYSGPDVWLTYGSYRSVPHSETCAPAAPFPDRVVRQSDFRRFIARGGGHRFNHLRTMRRKVFDALSDDDLLVDGRWPMAGGDMVVMLPALELAGRHVRFLPDVLYEYVSDREDSDWRVNARELRKVHTSVMRKPRRRPL